MDDQNGVLAIVRAVQRELELECVFVVDGSPFVTFPEKNPTLTIMALAVRAARYITEARRKGDL